MKKRAIVGFSLAALAISVSLGLGFGASKIGAAKHSTLAPQQGASADPRPLRERARQAGHYIGLENPNRTTVFTDLASLASSSSIAIIGTPQDNVCNLTPDGRSITIDYRVQVRHVYKGSLRQGDVITVSLPGGKVVFSDGSTAEIRTPWFKKMQTGQTYVLLLNAGPRSGTFIPTGGPQGVFQYGRSIIAHTGIQGDPVLRYHRMDARAFVREIRQAVQRR